MTPKTSVTVDGVVLTADQVEKAWKELGKELQPEPTIACLQPVTRIGYPDQRGVVIAGRVQEIYAREVSWGGGPGHSYTVVDASGTGNTYKTVEELLKVWAPVSV